MQSGRQVYTSVLQSINSWREELRMRFIRRWCAGLAVVIRGAVFGQVSPEESIKTFKLAGGLECTLFAAEPMLVNPCDIDVDARGRGWVCEGANYRQGAKP